MIKDLEQEIIELREEANRLLLKLKESPTEYKETLTKYNAVMGKLRYRTKPEYREKIATYKYNRAYKSIKDGSEIINCN